jgi:hypothetical protein
VGNGSGAWGRGQMFHSLMGRGERFNATQMERYIWVIFYIIESCAFYSLEAKIETLMYNHPER